jgi:hypothetical protein
MLSQQQWLLKILQYASKSDSDKNWINEMPISSEEFPSCL